MKGSLSLRSAICALHLDACSTIIAVLSTTTESEGPYFSSRVEGEGVGEIVAGLWKGPRSQDADIHVWLIAPQLSFRRFCRFSCCSFANSLPFFALCFTAEPATCRPFLPAAIISGLF